jgi:hypothetical protein
MALAVIGIGAASHAAAQATFYEDDNFRGRRISVSRATPDFARIGFNDRASSVVIRGGTWRLCQDAHFRGRCIVLNPGRYRSLTRFGFNDVVSSAGPARRPPPRPQPR